MSASIDIKKLISKSKQYSNESGIGSYFLEFDYKQPCSKERYDAYRGFDNLKSPLGTVALDNDLMFGAASFKKISGLELPTEIAEFFGNNPIFIYMQFPCVSDFDVDHFLDFVVEIMHPERIAKVMTNKWDHVCKSYHRRDFYDFKESNRLPVVYIGSGNYLTYNQDGEQGTGYYYFDEKIADTYLELLMRLSIHPNYFLPVESRGTTEEYDFHSFTKDTPLEPLLDLFQ